MADALDTPIARHIWDQRYRDAARDTSIEATWRRIAAVIAQAESTSRRIAGLRSLLRSIRSPAPKA